MPKVPKVPFELGSHNSHYHIISNIRSPILCLGLGTLTISMEHQQLASHISPLACSSGPHSLVTGVFCVFCNAKAYRDVVFRYSCNASLQLSSTYP